VSFLSGFDTKRVVVLHAVGTDSEERFEVEGQIQAKSGFFAIDAPIYVGDIVVVPDPRGGEDRRLAAKVDVNDNGPADMRHMQVHWSDVPPSRVAVVRRLGLENLHPEVVAVASDLFVDGHYSQAVFEALKALDRRVRKQSGLDLSGRE